MLEAGFLATKVRSHEFVKARGWEKHDTAPSLCLALASEVGELADLVAWKSPGGPIQDLPSLRDSIAQELADVIIILLRFAALYDVDLSRPLIYIHKHQINI
jgi:NTP pyrophosphatase (non-canonical NTP hydrolase)